MSEQRYMVQSGDGAHAKYFLHSLHGRPVWTSHVKQAHVLQDKETAEAFAVMAAGRSGEKCRAVKYGY